MQFDTFGQHTQVQASSSNRVLRNTYMLLALSMVPTVAGALLGVKLQFSFFAGSPFIGFLLFMGIAFGFFYGIERNKNSGVGVALLLAFTFFMGLMLSRTLQFALGFSNGGSMIATAAGGTAAIFGCMATIAATSKRDFSKMGSFLLAGSLLVLLAIVANIFLQMPVLHLAISAVIVVLFSAYMLYDIHAIVSGGETNYVTATLAVYLDVYNVFVSLLNLIMSFAGDRD
ncbi:Bax inhibitor-1 family protein [Zoogloea sp.]|uniref:Bax inhibitor-1 family protein n=1 Tax=Zoogloea sp. TaxID=49181 RepID=UPI0035B04CB2